ncbi:nuclear transport factor 2 family protein [Bacillus subtilis subsp. subtilis]|nr:nuclear transport factor 2 family protein [Bacillus subtilis subsp. subtilis]
MTLRHLACGLLLATLGAPAMAAPADAEPTLARTIAALDQKVFDAYNRCELDTFASYFSPTVEFYHDTGGATFDRATVVANTQKYICNKVRRELIPGTLKVYPIKDFGAIEEGEHRFCERAGSTCEGSARFVMVWQLNQGQWQMTRVLSYGHRTLTDAEKSALAADRAR